MTKFQDAQKMAAEHPTTFMLQSEDFYRDVLSPGDHAKVCESDERFWVYIKSISGDKITGLVANVLIGDSLLKFKDEVTFEYRHIYDFYTADDPRCDNEEGNLQGVHDTCN